MKKIWLLIGFFFLASSISYSQISNLIFCGQTGNFNRASGDTVSWSYNVPSAGDTTFVQIWIDVDNSGTLNSGDVLWNYFYQIDGDSYGQNGPPDIDGQANGTVSFRQVVGLAPAHYVVLFRNHGVYTTKAGVFTPLASPTFTILGHITVPNGYSPQNIAVSLQAEHGETFWSAITDTNGDFTIAMSSDTTGNPWKLKIDNGFIFGPSVILPPRINMTLDQGVQTSYTGNNFTVTAADAQISGVLRDENGVPVVNGGVSISSDNVSNRDAATDTAGVFHIGLLASELPTTNLTLNAGDPQDTTIVSAFYTFPYVMSGNNLAHDLVLFTANSTITGQVTFNNSPGGPGIQLYAVNPDTGQAQTVTSVNGNFIFHVSSKISNYQIQVNVPNGYNYSMLTEHAGDSNVNVNLTTTDVKSTGADIPQSFALMQNYPNPFNPSTAIKFSIPQSSFVNLKVYNILGKEVATLVNEEEPPGSYEVDFNPVSSNQHLASGIYFYKLEAGSFVATKKMILLK